MTVTGFEVLPLKLLSPEYTAVNVWLPAVRFPVVKLAVPPLKVPVPMVLPPSRKVTVPVAPDGVTEAVRLTGVVVLTEVADAESEVVVLVGVLFTCTVTGLDVLELKLVSPPYVAVKVWDPAVRPLAVKLADPFARLTVPIDDPSRKNCTEPVGPDELAPDAVTTAVKVTDWAVVMVEADADRDVVVLVFVPGFTTCDTELELTAA